MCKVETSFEHGGKGKEKKKESDSWVQKSPPKNPGKPNPDSKRGHGGRGTNK